MFQHKILFVVLLLFCIKLSTSDENYCDPSLCNEGESHIACDHYLEFAQDCGEEPELITFNAKEKKMILDIHNHHRSRVAAGKLPGYAPAARMPVLKWDADLSYIAGLHVRACTVENDSCRNTQSFRNSGQNVGFQIIEGTHHNTTGIVKSIIDNWVHNEYKLGNQENVKSVTEEDLNSMGRFFLIINERISDVGCAMVKYLKDEFYNLIFTCNYGSNTYLDNRVYEAGTPCSKCLTGCHRIYNGLCSPEEKVDPDTQNFDTDTDDYD